MRGKTILKHMGATDEEIRDVQMGWDGQRFARRSQSRRTLGQR